MNSKTINFLAVAALLPSPALAQAAFPGAEGFGAGATGGQGGSVYHVTTLGDSGPGSFRDAVSRGHRTVVFDIGGEIKLQSPVSVHSDITLSGENTPAAGITISGQEVSFSNARNVVVRYVRIRQGLTGRRGQSAIGIRGGSDLIFDHVSVAWGRWDTIDMNLCTNVTFQYCLIGPGVNPQRFGCLCQSDNVTFSHNLWIDNQSRNPKAKGHIQFVNNVVYDWGVDGLVGGHSAAEHDVDIINNDFIKGPSSSNRFTGEYADTDHVYQTGNVADLDKDGTRNGRPVTATDFGAAMLTDAPAMKPTIPVTVDTAQAAFDKVIADAGDSRQRDAIDAELISQAQSLGTRGKTIEDPAELGTEGK